MENKGQFKKGHKKIGNRGFQKGHKPTYVAFGNDNPSKRPEVRKKIQERTKEAMNRPEILEKISGKNSSHWKEEKTDRIYSIDWKISLRISIRERDKYICKICGEKQGDRAFSIHHIDYNKLNSNPKNLITLCAKCHTKTNFNRNYWKKYFINLIKN
jgi:formylmethanofuran dehydrogenase subunit E